MKLVSPKTLLASLLGCTFVVMKVMTFDGLVDMFWIIFIGYLTVKAIVTAFSQEAYDEDIRQAQQGKVLYRDLFGKFAYIAADVPILLILLAGLLASVCSATTLLRATLIGLLLIAVGYAIWFSWYVSKHKRLRMKNGEWGTGILSTEDEKAWKRSNLWHGIILGITGVLFALYLIFGDLRIYFNNAKLEKTLSTLDCDSITLEKIVWQIRIHCSRCPDSFDSFGGPFGFGLFRNNATQSHPDWTFADCSGICYLVQLVCFKA